MSTRLRLHLSGQALPGIITLISNSLALASNAYILTTGLRNDLRLRRQDAITHNLNTAAEVINATASIGRVIAETLGRKNAPD